MRMVYGVLADSYGWTVEQVNDLTVTQAVFYMERAGKARAERSMRLL